MSHSNRKTTVWVLVSLLVAVGIGASNANSQTSGKQWLECDVDWLVSDPYLESPDFTVKVVFRGQPISKVKVVLTTAQPDEPNHYVVATDYTDSDGVAHFFAIPPGRYQAHIDKGLLSPNPEIEVRTENTANEVRMEWPGDPVVTRSVRGAIYSWQKSAPQNRKDLLPLVHVQVQLLSLRNAKLLASAYTGREGDYEFSGLSDGLYVIRVNEYPDPSITGYDKAVEVTPDAIREHMPRLEVDSGCGAGLLELLDVSYRDKAPISPEAAGHDPNPTK